MRMSYYIKSNVLYIRNNIIMDIKKQTKKKRKQLRWSVL
jgi:hypothetical protein